MVPVVVDGGVVGKRETERVFFIHRNDLHEAGRRLGFLAASVGHNCRGTNYLSEFDTHQRQS